MSAATEQGGEQGGDPRTGPGRPRSAATHTAILVAVAELLAEGGYPAASIEAVATRAGVGKQTIYRWWPGRPELVLEHLIGVAAKLPMPDTGNLAEDLRIYLRATCFGWTTGGTGPVVAALMAQAQVDERFGARFYRALIAGRRAALRTLLGKGQARGELAADRDLDLLLDLIYGPLWYRLLLRHAPLDDGFIEQLLGALDLVAPDSVRKGR
ncbi:MAG TPA: TetR/AcrR family transcriptional regulator [Terriglobales bacterium]|nr:TetR/AcrR family transcriptional regulator [Terriglobales bacterium]